MYNGAVNEKIILEKYKSIKDIMPKQDHNYVLDIENSCNYGRSGFGDNMVALYLRCEICNCLLISTVAGEFKFNSNFYGYSSDDIDNVIEFLTCKENIIKSIIE